MDDVNFKMPYSTAHTTSVIYQSGTKASEKEILELACLMENSALKNIDSSIANIEAKILDLEGIKVKS